MNLYETDDWSVALPAGWRGEREDDCDALFHPQELLHLGLH